MTWKIAVYGFGGWSDALAYDLSREPEVDVAEVFVGLDLLKSGLKEAAEKGLAYDAVVVLSSIQSGEIYDVLDFARTEKLPSKVFIKLSKDTSDNVKTALEAHYGAGNVLQHDTRALLAGIEAKCKAAA